MSTQIQQTLASARPKKPAAERARKRQQTVAETPGPKRHLFSVKDYRAMVEAGVLKEDDRVELIEGEIIEMSPIGSLHAACVKRLNHLLGAKVGQKAIVSVQDPIQIADSSEPQPDIALLKYRKDFYKNSHPRAKDVLLIIEVADTSVAYDRESKIPLYARANVAQAILVDLQAEMVEVYARPVKGAYTRIERLGRGQAVKLQKLPTIKLSVDEILS